MARTVLIAPVGWYEKRLLSSIYKSAADKIYLIRGKNGPYEAITNSVAQRLKKTLPPSLDVNIEEMVDFRVYTDILSTFTKIIEIERKVDKQTKIIVDVTSSTKDGVIAASLIARLYDVNLSYIPRGEVEEWATQLGKKPPEEILDEDLKEDVNDPGGKYIQYRVISVPIFEERWIIPLRKLYEGGGLPMRKLVKKIVKETGEKRKISASNRYWGRVLHRLKDELLVEMSKVNKETFVKLSDVGRSLVEGMDVVYKKSTT